MITRNRMTIVVVFFMFLAISASSNAAFSLTWHRVVGCTVSDSTINGWISAGNDKLCQDDDGAGSLDVHCALTIARSGTTDTSFTYTGGDDELNGSTDVENCYAAMTRNCVAVTSLYYDGKNCAGLEWNDKIIIVSNAPSSTLIHEIGHIANCEHVDPAVTKRIMNKVATDENCRVITDEQTRYESLDDPA